MTSLHRVLTLAKFKCISILKNKQIGPMLIMGLGMPFIFKMVLPEENIKSLMTLSMGLMFITIMGANMSGLISIVEEKEKNTLRVLMTSSVTELEYLLATLLPTIVILAIMTFLLIPISGLSFSEIGLAKFLLICIVNIILNTIVGFIIALFAKTTAEASAYLMIPMLLLCFVPFFSLINKQVKIIADFMYTELLFNMVNDIGNNVISLQEIGILIAWTIILIGIFIYFYRKNGLDNE